MSGTMFELAAAYLKRPEQIRPLVDCMMEEADAAALATPFGSMLEAFCDDGEGWQRFELASINFARSYLRPQMVGAKRFLYRSPSRSIWMSGKTQLNRFRFDAWNHHGRELKWSFTSTSFIVAHTRRNGIVVPDHWRYSKLKTTSARGIARQAFNVAGLPGVLAVAMIANKLSVGLN